MSIVVKRVLLVLAMASMMIQAVNAGPVSRELEDRGDDVGVPKQRPKQQDFFLQQSERLNKPQIAADQPVSASGEDPDLPLVQIPTQPAEAGRQTRRCKCRSCTATKSQKGRDTERRN